MVLLLRLNPAVPFTPINYAVSLTCISAWDFLWASAIGLIPSTHCSSFLSTYALFCYQQWGSQIESVASPLTCIHGINDALSFKSAWCMLGTLRCAFGPTWVISAPETRLHSTAVIILIEWSFFARRTKDACYCSGLQFQKCISDMLSCCAVQSRCHMLTWAVWRQT